MRRIALINQKGGVGKTTTAANLGAALALAGKRVVVVDLDPQANLTLFLGVELPPSAPSSYRVLTGEVSFAAALRDTSTPNLRLLPTDIHLSGAEHELSSTEGREKLMRAALDGWVADHKKAHRGEEPADYVLFDCPPSLGLLSLNALAAADEVFLVVQTQFLALQGMSKLVEVIELVKQRLHPRLKLSGIVPCMYDSRMRLAREVLAELRRYFPAQVFRTPISANVKLAESPSFAKTIFEYAPDSIGARDFASLSHEVLTQEVLARPAAEPEPARRKLDLGEALRGSGAARALTPPSEAPEVTPARKREAAKTVTTTTSAATPAARIPAAKRVEVAPPAEPTRAPSTAPRSTPPAAVPVAAPTKRERVSDSAPTPVVKAKKAAPAAPVEPKRAPALVPPLEKPFPATAPTTTAAAPATKKHAPGAGLAPTVPATRMPAAPSASTPRVLPPAPKTAARESGSSARPAPAKLEPRREPAPAPVFAAPPAAESKPEGGAKRPRSKPAASG